MAGTRKTVEKLKLLYNEVYNNIIDDYSIICNYFDMSSVENELESHNVARKAIVILLYMWSREGIIPPFEIESVSLEDQKHYISFFKDYIHSFYTDDIAYSNAAMLFLKKYDWRKSRDWNYSPYYDSQSDEEVFRKLNEKLQEEYKEYVGVEFADFDYQGTSTFYFEEFTNPKLDLVNSIWNVKTKKQKNEQMRADFSEICSTADFFLSPFSVLPIYQDRIINVNEKGEIVHHYVCIFPELIDESGYVYTIDMSRMYRTNLFYTVAKLDGLMDDFIKKWLFY